MTNKYAATGISKNHQTTVTLWVSIVAQSREHRVRIPFRAAPYHSQKNAENTLAINCFRP
ncbi:MAG: hypothetical protein IPP88_00255 [Betaproteobacteria bacterium]|nr:hypothetical protein [Betaproteobacteria bacterium]